MKYFVEAIFYQYYLFYKKGKYDWGISPEANACWALGFSLFFPFLNFCFFIFACIVHEISYHWYYLIPFYISWIGINKICERKFIINGRYKYIIKEKPTFSNNKKLNAIITIIYTFIMTFGSSYLIVLAKHLK